MFFLGASANILVYLLVSAFFVVCCYFSGEPENRHFAGDCSMIITYSPGEKQFDIRQTVSFTAEIQQPDKPLEEKISRLVGFDSPPFFQPFYVAPFSGRPALRAPPRFMA